jgi:2-C-methyl-D-erythritol 2,4-cyclodiphosphate synthase
MVVLRRRAFPVDAPRAGDDGRLRAGVGVDAHRLEPGRPMRLGGLEFPNEPAGLAGHSDGDVALHAVTDALLGAAGLGDIGTIFPSTDETWQGADSGDLLLQALTRVRAAGFRPRSVDVAIGAERPAIGPRRDEMAARMAGLLEVGPDAVTVRGTTTDGLGFPGSEGIAVWAVALIEPVA